MGLDFNNSSASWSYGGFHRFRTALAAEIGLELEEMEGFTDKPKKSWDEVTDPIVALLNHSDSDGELTPKECKQIAPRLKELVQDWPEDESSQGYDRATALQLAEDMLECAKRRRKLVFC